MSSDAVNLGPCLSRSPLKLASRSFGRHERRYWDSSKWTDHVVSRGRQEVDPPVDRPQVPAVNTAQTPAAWHPDPFGRHELRYWDGGQWSHHVLSRGSQGIDPPVGGTTVPTESPQGPNGSPPPMVLPVGGSPGPTVNRASKKVQRQVHMSGVPDRGQVGNGSALHRAGPGRQPEGQALRRQRRVRGL
ncbi:MAG: DUF2510 domain-containing protein [Nocardioidaceae bacterium]